MPKSVLVLSPYPYDRAPSQRLKYEQYFDYFEDNGFDITTSSFISYNFWKLIYKRGKIHLKIWYTIEGYLRRIKDLLRASKYDLVYVHLWVTPLGFPLFEYALKSANANIIYDIDDLIYLKNKSKSNAFMASMKGRNKPLALMKMAKEVIVCTPTLEQFAQNFNTNTTDISSTINTEVYKQKEDYELGDQLVLGWSGSHSTSKYLMLLKDVFIELGKHFKFKILVIGDANFKIEGVNIEAIPWTRESEVEDLSRIDIGLYPLPDEEWVYGKSGLKALQYMALGIPTIATAIGANFRIIEDNVSGVLIPPGEMGLWKTRLIQLYKDRALRRKLGRNGRVKVEQYYSVESNKDKYLSILKRL